MSWSDRNARTFEEVVVRLIVEGRTQSEDFQRLLRFYGREKLERIYKDWKKKQYELQTPEKEKE